MIPVKILALRYLANAEPGLARSLGAPEGYPSLAMLTTDCDDATYIALDEATKAADVKVCYARSFYAGAANATTPNAGEVIGILAGPTPGAVRSGMDAALKAADVKLCKLYAPPSETNFGGGLLSGTQSACDAACAAFTRRVAEVAAKPMEQ